MTASPQIHRRTVAGAASLGLGLPVLAACGADESSVPTDTDPTGTSTGTPTGTPTATTPTESSTGPDTPVDAFASTADIQVGGGTIYPDDEIVITQPTEGEFKCFSAVCTHRGCIVSGVAGGNIDCVCHGSAFSIADGSVVNGPATQPLAERTITVQGNVITLG